MYNNIYDGHFIVRQNIEIFIDGLCYRANSEIMGTLKCTCQAACTAYVLLTVLYGQVRVSNVFGKHNNIFEEAKEPHEAVIIVHQQEPKSTPFRPSLAMYDEDIVWNDTNSRILKQLSTGFTFMRGNRQVSGLYICIKGHIGCKGKARIEDSKVAFSPVESHNHHPILTRMTISELIKLDAGHQPT